MKVAVVGAGRMGSLVAQKLAPEVEKLIIDTDPAKAAAVAAQAGGVARSQLAGAAEADVIILALPAEGIAPSVAALAALASPRALVLNLATAADTTQVLATESSHAAGTSGLRVIPVKIIGHAREIAAGVPPLVVVDTPRDDLLGLVQNLLRGFGPVVRGSERLVQIANTIASEEGVKAALAMQERLKAAGVPEEWVLPAVQGPGAGTMKAFAAGDMGPFVRALVERLQGRGEHGHS